LVESCWPTIARSNTPRRRPRALLAASRKPPFQIDLADPLDQRRHRRAVAASAGTGFGALAASSSLPVWFALLAKGLDSLAQVIGDETHSRSAIRPLSACSLRTGFSLSTSIAACCRASRAARGGDLGRRSTAARSSSSSTTTSWTRPICSARSAGKLRPVRKSSCPGQAERVEELAQAGVAVDEAELGGRHAQFSSRAADP